MGRASDTHSPAENSKNPLPQGRFLLYRGYVRFWTAAKHARGFGKLAVTGLMFFLWLGTFSVAASPQLHQLLHKDAHNLNHHCLITQLKQYSPLAGAPTAIIPAPAQAALSPLFSETQFLASFDYQVSFSRGPPALFSSKTVVG